MKFLFLDEFKYDYSQSHKVYGLTGVVIDAQYYLSFKESFSSSLKKLGWDKKLELKGRSMFSASGDKSVSVEKRVNFMSDVVGMSQSKTGKTAKIHVFVALEMYEKKHTEYDCYKKNLEKIIKKLPKAQSKKKSLVGIFYDENDCIDASDFQQTIEKLLSQRSLNLFESPLPVKSSLDNPGIMFADYVCYFNQNFFQLSNFRKNINDELMALLEKDEKNTITEDEKKKLSTYITNYKKEKKTKELILALKKIVFV
ncbi:MAG: hypothetical protein RIQ54_536 [Candidatus Parcubacteria bacterium]|jgi:hypothetical protein